MLGHRSTLHPYGIATLSPSPVRAQQDYDVSLSLSMPRSAANVDRGNFMISLYLLDRDVDAGLAAQARKFADDHHGFGSHRVLLESRRPALLPYTDPMVSIASRVLFLFYHMLVPSSHSITMTIPLAEHVSFSRGSTLPSSAYVEVEAGQTIQVYHAELIITAQLHGLRWWMHRYRLPTYLAFTLLFWLAELFFMAFAWLSWIMMLQTKQKGASPKLKRLGRGPRSQGPASHSEHDDGDNDDDDLADDDELRRPLLSQPPRKFETGMKKEAEQELSLLNIPLAGGEADDEGEDGDLSPADDSKQRESATGTSYSERGTSHVRKRVGSGAW